MIWLSLGFELIKKSYLFLGGLLGIFLLGRNSTLAKENDKLKIIIEDKDKLIKIQSKVLNAAQNNKPADLNTSIKRMRQKEL